MQERLIRAMNGFERTVWNARRILDAANVLDLKVVATEQNPEKLGLTLPSLSERINIGRMNKMCFSAAQCSELNEFIQKEHVSSIIIIGIETHVCVLQSALEFQSMGFNTHVVSDAVASRSAYDHDIAIERLRADSVTVTSTEAAIFELCGTAERQEFKRISSLIKETLSDN